ncbi:pyridoxal phosphate-dependent aminotransferase family protein [Streptomyces cinnamoneus]|uniref:aminotransferase class I/II-fold pyridoxal phosphate-dependent enzyme n=1 Tax=Streptomyces cinnamoneus TaxID=53446 RepID=UPI003438DF2C
MTSQPHGKTTALVMNTGDYLGLAGHPEITRAMRAALDRFGSAARAAGPRPLHRELEERLARWLGAEAALTFGSGYLACLGALPALCDSATVVAADQYSHPGVIDGCRLAEGRIRIFSHNSMAKLEYLLERHASAEKRFIAVDGLYAADGEPAPLAAIAALARRHDATTVVGEAHGLGVLGPGGRGACAGAGIAPDLLTGTFATALAGTGGFVAGRRDVVGRLHGTAHPSAVGTGLPPVAAAGALAALDLLQREPWRPLRLRENAARLRNGLRALGFDVTDAPAPVVTVPAGDAATALRLARGLRERGVDVVPPRHRAVLARCARLRLTVTATLRPRDIDHVLEALHDVAAADGLVG